MNKLITYLIGFILLTWIAGFAISPEKNPQGRHTGNILSLEGDKILKNSCFDCHSNETVWPWYSYVPPMSALVAYDVRMGRKHLNFSEWDSMTDRKKGEALEEALEEIEEGEMPMKVYLIMHGDAALTPNQIDKLTQDVGTFYGWEYTEISHEEGDDEGDKEGDEHEEHDH